MSVFNCRKYVAAAIDSILAQDMPDFECIVVDDGSNDGTANILAAYDDERVRIISLPVNTNHGVAQNLGIGAAQGEYLAMMDADDVAFPQRLAVQARFLDEHPEIDMVGARCIRVAETLDREIDRPAHPVDDAIIKARLLLMNGSSLLHPTTMVRSSFVRDNNLWYLPRKMSVDTAFWIKCVAKGVRFHALEQPLIYKRRHGENVTVRHRNTWEPEKTSLRVELLGMYFPELTGSEVKSLALLMESGRSLHFVELCSAIAAGNKALREVRSFFGESRPHLHAILRDYIARAVSVLSGPRGQPA